MFASGAHRVMTRAEDGFKLTAAQRGQALEGAPDARLVSVRISNNPTTFAYSHDELKALLVVAREAAQAGRELDVLAGVAAVGTRTLEQGR